MNESLKPGISAWIYGCRVALADAADSSQTDDPCRRTRTRRP